MGFLPRNFCYFTNENVEKNRGRTLFPANQIRDSAPAPTALETLKINKCEERERENADAEKQEQPEPHKF